MNRTVNLVDLMSFILDANSFKDVLEALLVSRDQKLTQWNRNVMDKYPEGDSFPVVPENFRKEITMIKMCLGGLS